MTADAAHLPVLLPHPDLALVAVGGAAVLHPVPLGEHRAVRAGAAPGAGRVHAGGGPGGRLGGCAGGPGGC